MVISYTTPLDVTDVFRPVPEMTANPQALHPPPDPSSPAPEDHARAALSRRAVRNTTPTSSTRDLFYGH